MVKVFLVVITLSTHATEFTPWPTLEGCEEQVALLTELGGYEASCEVYKLEDPDHTFWDHFELGED